MSDNLAKTDPNVRVPAAVQAIAAAAAARQEAYIAGLNAEPEGEDPQLTPGVSAEGAPAAPAPAPQPQPAPPPQADPEDESFRQKFLSAQGRLEKAQQQMGQMSEQIEAMQRAMTTLQLQQEAPAQTETRTYKKLITEQEEQEFGTEFLDVVGRKAQEAFEPLKAEYEAKIARLERQVQGVGGYVAQSARDQMEAQMDRDLPTWREINYRQEFMDWLKLPDPYSGVIRMNTLKAAYEQNDTPRVRAFFKGFLAEEAATAPAGQQPGLTPSPAAGGNGKVPLESLAAPGRAKTAAASGAPTEKPVFTRQEVTEFYVQVANGKWRGRDAERIQRDHEIMLAGTDGRIR